MRSFYVCINPGNFPPPLLQCAWQGVSRPVLRRPPLPTILNCIAPTLATPPSCRPSWGDTTPPSPSTPETQPPLPVTSFSWATRRSVHDYEDINIIDITLPPLSFFFLNDSTLTLTLSLLLHNKIPEITRYFSQLYH